MTEIDSRNMAGKYVMPSIMASYKERVLKAIEESEDGINTINVSKSARISRTTAIKYLSELKSEGKCEYVEVGPCKLWKVKTANDDFSDNMQDHSEENVEGILHHISRTSLESNPEDAIISMSFKVEADKVGIFLDLLKHMQYEKP